MCPGRPLRYQKQDEKANIFKVCCLWTSDLCQPVSGFSWSVNLPIRLQLVTQNKVNFLSCPLQNGYFQLVPCQKLLIGFSDSRLNLIAKTFLQPLVGLKSSQRVTFCLFLRWWKWWHTSQRQWFLKRNNNSWQNNLLADFVCKSYCCKIFCVYCLGMQSTTTSDLSRSSSLLWTCHCGLFPSDVEMFGLWLNTTLSSQNISRIHKCFRVGRHRLRDMRRCSQSGIPAAWVSSQEASEQQQEVQSHMGNHPPIFCSSESTHNGPESELLRLCLIVSLMPSLQHFFLWPKRNIGGKHSPN